MVRQIYTLPKNVLEEIKFHSFCPKTASSQLSLARYGAHFQNFMVDQYHIAFVALGHTKAYWGRIVQEMGWRWNGCSASAEQDLIKTQPWTIYFGPPPGLITNFGVIQYFLWFWTYTFSRALSTFWLLVLWAVSSQWLSSSWRDGANQEGSEKWLIFLRLIKSCALLWMSQKSSP